MVVDFETRFFLRSAIEATNVSEKVELQTRRALEKCARSNDVLARDDNGGFAQRLDNFIRPFRMLTL